MSRSYRKPCVKENGGTKKGKIAANRHIRRSSKCQDIGNGNNYKKYYCSWDITDYKWLYWKTFKHTRSWCTTSYEYEEEFHKMVQKYSRK